MSATPPWAWTSSRRPAVRRSKRLLATDDRSRGGSRRCPVRCTGRPAQRRPRSRAPTASRRPARRVLGVAPSAHPCRCRGSRPMGGDDNLAQRLLDGDKRALARAITLVESDDPAGWELVREVYPHTGNASIVGLTGAPGAGKSTLIGALIKLRREQDRESRRAVDRPVLAVHPRRAARRPHPADRALPRPRRLHPLDGQPRRARRPERGGAAGRAADGRRRQATTSSWRPSASARPRSTSSTTPTPSCSC